MRLLALGMGHKVTGFFPLGHGEILDIFRGRYSFLISKFPYNNDLWIKIM